MTPWFARAWFPMIRREMRNKANIQRVDLHGLEHLRAAIASGAGVLVTPNHSFHYDSYVLSHAAHEVARPFHVMAAWQVFQAATPLERFIMRRSGVFSIDRESADLGAFKRAVEILRSHQCPLVIFPEGDIYHTNDRVRPFREGAAAIALSAAKRADRPTVVIPAAIKCRYVTDPTPGLLDLMCRLEESLHWRPHTHLSLPERIYRFAEGLLALKELEYLGHHQSGTVQSRTAALIGQLIDEQEQRHTIEKRTGTVPERVKELRRHHIERLDGQNDPLLPDDERRRLERDMEDLFFVIQLYSYPGDYVAEKPSIERIAETLDKFEEDVLDATYPKPRGTRHATVRFGEPIPLANERASRDATAALTTQLEQRVQGLLDQV
ncbi:MAG: lysophospholipid acyltransferase family protein [Planctomycetota bacterium]